MRTNWLVRADGSLWCMRSMRSGRLMRCVRTSRGVRSVWAMGLMRS